MEPEATLFAPTFGPELGLAWAFPTGGAHQDVTGCWVLLEGQKSDPREEVGYPLEKAVYIILLPSCLHPTQAHREVPLPIVKEF